MTAQEWVDTWVSVPQPTGAGDLPPPPFTLAGRTLAGTTLRQTVRASIGGRRLRLRLSNLVGGTALPVTAASVALPLGGRAGTSAIQPATLRRVSFHGRPSVVVPAGAQAESDPVDVDVAPGANLTVTLYLGEGQPAGAVTSHPGSRTTSYLLAGDHVAAVDLPGAAPVDHWYILSGLSVPATATAAGVVLVGDSLTDGRGSTTNQNDRWPDRLFDRLRSRPDLGDIAVLRHAAGGTQLLDDGQGPGAVDRLVRAALSRTALRWLLVFKGVNDIGAAAPTGAAQRRVSASLIQAYDQIISRLHQEGVRVYGSTLLPFGGNADCDDLPGHREWARQGVNEWVRGSGRFDAVLDFDRAVRDPADPRRLAPAFDAGDHLHLNPAGYRALADSVPLHLFRTA